MRSDIRIHLTAVLVICTIVSVIFVFFAPKNYGETPTGQTISGAPSIEVYSATWGENCNGELKKLVEAESRKPLKTDDKGMIIEGERTQLVKRDNVLAKVAELCNGKSQCDLSPTSELLGLEPFAPCLKNLDVRYRCFDFDRLRNKTITQGHNETIDCSSDSTATGKAPATAQ